MRIGICEFTTSGASFSADLEAYRAAGVEGIGVFELKLGEGDEARFHESGLRATHCVPAGPSILPLPLMEAPHVERVLGGHLEDRREPTRGHEPVELARRARASAERVWAAR